MNEVLMTPKVSIMVPVYNAHSFIKECIESILNQSYSNIELVVSDDCSTDGTQDILRNYIKDERIKLFFNKKNLGVTHNCNQALSACTGKYVCFFAGDDLMLPGKIAAQVELMESNSQASMVYHRVNVFNSRTNKTYYDTEVRQRTIYSFFDILEKGGLPGANSVMARRDCIPSTFYNIYIASVSDWMMFIELSLRGEILFLDKIYARYRKHEGGVSSQADVLLDETLETLKIIEKRFGGNSKISSSCARGRRRYLFGSLYRAIYFGNGLLIADLVKRFKTNKNYLISICIYIYSKTFFNMSWFNRFICSLVKR